jgi:signal transduction histidine kinase
VALARPRGADELTDAIGGALEDLGRLRQLVDALLVLARADEGRLPGGGDPIDLTQLARELVALHGPAAEERAMRIEVRGAAEPVVVRASRQLLARAAGNLVGNAVVHGRTGGRVVVVVSAEAARARLEVRDDGPGIPEAERAQLFERFHRGASARDGGGFGLGLSIARRLVEAQGGTVSFAPSPEGGSAFVIELVRG